MRHQLNSSNLYDGNGTFSFNGTYTDDALADLMVGALQAYNASMPTAFGFRQTYIGLYAQDDYRVNSRLNVHAGLRWEPFLPETDVYGRGRLFLHVGLLRQSAQLPIQLLARRHVVYRRPGNSQRLLL